MAKVAVFAKGVGSGSGLVLRQAPPNTKKRTFLGHVLGMYNVPGTISQLKAQIALGSFMSSNIGTNGKDPVTGNSILAEKAGDALRGQSHGGMSADERRRAAHAAAQRNIAKLRARIGQLEGRGVTPTAGVGAGMSAMF